MDIEKIVITLFLLWVIIMLRIATLPLSRNMVMGEFFLGETLGMKLEEYLRNHKLKGR